MDRRSYSYCSVLLCENNSKNAPEKLFIPVPRKAEIRKKWLQLARREPEKLSIISSLHFCEDHFDTADIQETDRKIFIIRHGERVDLVFPIWISECFDQAGNYIRTDPNMPRSLPKRKRGSLGFPVDAPLTNAGVFQASMIGEQLNYKKDSISHIYCSPALRSIQTANAIIQQLENRDELKIRIEPGLYEMARWYKHFQLDWMSPEELLEAGYNVDVDYKPVFKASDVISNFKETSAQYYERGAAVTDAALKNHPTGNILLVGHASTAEICSHKLLKRRPREYNDLIDFMLQVPFCAMSQLSSVNNQWSIAPYLSTADNQQTDGKIFIIRHGERVDLVFHRWISECFDQNDNYVRKDLNMPRSLPKRKKGSLGFLVDTPLTNAGIFQASMIGEQLNDEKENISHIYCSPALRSIQTANAIIQQLENRDELKIRIEPGLYEMPRWYKHFQLDWMSPEELLEAGYKVDVDYKPVFKASDVINNLKETSAQYYERGAAVTDAALKSHPTGNILLVGHASTAEICSHKLLKRRPREYNDLIDFMMQVPFCAMFQLSYVNHQWSIAPYLSVTHSNNYRFDWRLMDNHM